MAWRLAKSLEKLRDQVNTLHPNRSKASDGTIGDAQHANTVSDHNPVNGVVTALDLTHDPAHGLDANNLAEALRNSRDPRIKYVIFNGRAFDPYNGFGWGWQPYTGSNPHTSHIHISVTGDYDSTKAWDLGLINQPLGGNMEKPLNSGDKENIIKVTGNSPDEVKSKGDWNNVYYSVLQPRILRLQGNLREIDFDLKKAEFDNRRLVDQTNKLTEDNLVLKEENEALKAKPSIGTDFVQRLTSRKFIIAAVSSLVPLGNAVFGWGLTVDQVLTFLAPVLLFIGIEGLKDVKEVESK
jgi:hypothetical protein